MSWQLFRFLHTCVICIDVQLIIEQRYNFFMNEQKGRCISTTKLQKGGADDRLNQEGKSFGGCICYVMSKDNANIIASDYRLFMHE